MNNEENILDANLLLYSKNKKAIFKLLLFSGLTLVIFLLLMFLDNYFSPESWKNNNEPSTLFLIIVLLLFLLNSIQAPKYLNQYDSNMSKMKIVMFSIINLFIVTMLFAIFQSIIIYGKNGVDIPISVVTAPLMISLLGTPISNIKIHLLRKNKLMWPIILFVIFWVFTIAVII